MSKAKIMTNAEEQEIDFSDENGMTADAAEDTERSEEVETVEDVGDEEGSAPYDEGSEKDDFDGKEGTAETSADEGFTLQAANVPAVKNDKNIAAKAAPALSVKPSAYVPPVSTPDPVTKEPYRWSECTINIQIQLLPQKGEPERTAIIGIRTHLDAPLIKRMKADRLEPLPACIADLIAEMKEELPIRAAAYVERERKHGGKNNRDAPAKKAKLKSGRHLAANLFDGKKNEPAAATGTSEVEDDFFSEPFDTAQSTSTGNAKTSTDKTAAVSVIASRGKTQKKGKLKTPAPLAGLQGSLLG